MGIRVLACVAALLGMASLALGADGTWTNLAGGAWGTTGNWEGGVIAGGADAVADFSTLNITANVYIINNTPRAVGALLFGDTTSSHSWTLANSALTLATSSGIPSITVSNQTATISLAMWGTQGFIKNGVGCLTLSGANTYTGLTTVSAGTLRVQNNAALGATNSGTLIVNGATLDLGGTLAAQALILNAEQITVSGAGVNGRGAVNISSNTSQYNALRLLSLAGDTTFGGEQSGGRWDLRNVNGPSSLAMNGHTITKVGSNYVGLRGVTVVPGSGIIDIKEGFFIIESDTRMGGDSNNVMSVRGGAAFALYQLATPVTWSLAMDADSRFYSRAGNVTNQNIWSGPVTLNGRAVFDGVAGTLGVVSGNIAGDGSVVKMGAGSSTYFTGTNNTYAGATTVSNGTLYAKYPGSLPGQMGGALSVHAGGMIAVPVSVDDRGWTAEQVRDMHNASTFTAADADLGIDTSLTNFNYTYAFPRPMGLAKLGKGILTLTGSQSVWGRIRANGGTLVLDGATINATNANSYIGDAASDFGTLVLKGDTVFSSYLPAYFSGAWQALVVGNSGRGILVLEDNASVTNKLHVGAGAGSAGAVYQSGNSVMHNWGGAANDGRIGIAGYGYYELNSGTLTNNGYTQLGHALTGIGILNQAGGRFQQGNVFGGQLGISRGGTGMVYLAGGTFVSASSLILGESSDNGMTRGFAAFTVDNQGDASVSGNILMADRTNMFSAVNLNGGRLTANMFTKGLRAGSLALVNFNGGTFRARTAGNLFDVGARSPDAVNIYAGGATFDTGGLDVAIPVTLRAPAGSGVAGITIAPRGGYIGPPFVTITGGGGTGATAIALFDSASGFVSGIRVTCPGTGYTSAPTVTLSGGGTNLQTAVTGVSLAANFSGGLTKQGDGTLTLSGANCYAGATTISNGILRLGVAGALPSGTDLNVAGGTLDMGGFTVTNGTVTAASGVIINGSLICDGLSKVGSGTLTLDSQLVSSGEIAIEGGTVRLQGFSPGLSEGAVGGSFSTSSNNPSTAVQLSTRMANTAAGWTGTNTYIYSGYIWNRAVTNVTWTFAENFDDSVLLKIDGAIVLNNSSWTTPTLANYTLAPGVHSISAYFGNAGGTAGPVNNSWWKTSAIGFGVDFSGRIEPNVANFVALADPGDGSLLTISYAGNNESELLSASSVVRIDAGAVLDLGRLTQTFAGLSGVGTVSNGTVCADVSPAGTNAVGVLAIGLNTAIAGGYYLCDVTAAGASDRISAVGDFDFSGLALRICETQLLNRARTYTLASCAGNLFAGFLSHNLPPGWRLVRAYDSQLGAQVIRLEPFMPVPDFTLTPTGRTVVAGDGVSFEVSVFSVEPVTYQWRRNGVPIIGANGPTLTLSGVTVADSGNYDVVVSNSGGSAVGAPAQLLVTYLPSAASANYTYDALGRLVRAEGAADMDRVTYVYDDAYNLTFAYPAFEGPDLNGNGIPDAWEVRYFGSTGIVGMYTDLNGNGEVDFLDYAFGNDPLSSARPDGFTINVNEVEDRGFMYLTYQRNTYAAQLKFTILVSDDLINWQSGAGLFEQDGAPVDNLDGTETLTLRPLFSAKVFSKLFARILVEAR